MARKFKLFGQEIIIGKRLLGVGKDDEYFGVANYDNGRAIKKLGAYRGLVYSCINRVADSYASYSPYLEEQSGKEYKVVESHPFLEFLNKPSGPDPKAVPVSLFDVLFATSALIELQGSAYWYIPRGTQTGTPKEIVVLRADKVYRDLDKDGEIKNFYVRKNGSKVTIPIEEILPFIGFDPRDPYRGVGTVEAGQDYIETESYSTKFTKNFFLNNAGISGVLTFGKNLTKGAFKKAVRAWRDRYQGVGNAGKVMMIRDSDANFTKVGLGLNELDMDALRKMSREDIALMFGVPLALLGKAEENGLGRANIEALEYIFAKYTIEPKLKRLDAILQFALERYFPDSRKFKICHTNIIPEDKEFELARNDKGVDRWITRNEIRRKAGLPDVEGGDDLRAPLNSIPINEDLSSTDDNAGKSSGTGVKIKIKRKLSQAELEPKKKDGIDSTVKENFRLRLMKNQIAYERRYKKKFNSVLTDQRKEALDNLEAHASSFEEKTKVFGQKLFDDSMADAAMEKILMPTLIDLGEEQGALALLFAGDDAGEFIMNAPYEKLLRESTHKMASNFNDETLEALNKTLAEGIQAGEALGDLKNRVEETYDGAKGYRAERVARTETLSASNEATNEAYRQTGYVKEKEWYVNPGACEECEPFSGKTIPLDDSFLKEGQSYEDANGDVHENTYSDVDSPPLHPNCRCTIIPVR